MSTIDTTAPDPSVWLSVSPPRLLSPDDFVAMLQILTDLTRRDTVWCFWCQNGHGAAGAIGGRGVRRPAPVVMVHLIGGMPWFSHAVCLEHRAKEHADVAERVKRSQLEGREGSLTLREQSHPAGELLARVFTVLQIDALEPTVPSPVGDGLLPETLQKVLARRGGARRVVG